MLLTKVVVPAVLRWGTSAARSPDKYASSKVMSKPSLSSTSDHRMKNVPKLVSEIRTTDPMTRIMMGPDSRLTGNKHLISPLLLSLSPFATEALWYFHMSGERSVLLTTETCRLLANKRLTFASFSIRSSALSSKNDDTGNSA